MKRLQEAGEIIGIDLLNHVIVGDGIQTLRRVSLKEWGRVCNCIPGPRRRW